MNLKHKEKYPDIEALAQEGVSGAEIARRLDINYSTLRTICRTQKIALSTKRGRPPVENPVRKHPRTGPVGQEFYRLKDIPQPDPFKR